MIFTKSDTKLSTSLPYVFNTTFLTNNCKNNGSRNTVKRSFNVIGILRKRNRSDL